jgi:CxxC motif-containing protein (DUF1111 family)
MPLGRLVYALVPALVASAASAAELTPSEQIELGRRIFTENWLRPPADDSPLALSRSGDGLGPMFNGASCAECHRLGGIGGAGPNDHNVEIVSLTLPLDADQNSVRSAMRKAKRLHPEFLRETNVFLHRFGRAADGSLARYADFRETLRGDFPEEVLPASETERLIEGGLPFQLAQRNTPALFGVGLVESIKPEIIRRTAEAQRKEHPDLAGLPADGGAGRYGWRGHVPALDRFVRTACAEELGMRVHNDAGGIQDQPPWPVDGSAKVSRTTPPVDLSDEQVAELVAFVRSLPRPRETVPADSAARREVEAGRELFAEVGCAVCHVPDMGPVDGIYSDMLLHDMGPAFADRVAAPIDLVPPQVYSETHIRGELNVIRTGSYSGMSMTRTLVPMITTAVLPPSLNDMTKATQAFRTPALWGVADSAPYLHDGRANSLDEAIRLHGGQSKGVADRYMGLLEKDRSLLLAFLGTLRAPETAEH